MYDQLVHLDARKKTAYFNGVNVNTPYFFPSQTEAKVSQKKAKTELPPRGIEPRTFGLQDQRSATELQRRGVLTVPLISFVATRLFYFHFGRFCSIWIQITVTFVNEQFTVKNDQYVTVTFTTGGTICVEVPDVPEFRGAQTLCGVAGNIDDNKMNDIVCRQAYKTQNFLLILNNEGKNCKNVKNGRKKYRLAIVVWLHKGKIRFGRTTKILAAIERNQELLFLMRSNWVTQCRDILNIYDLGLAQAYERDFFNTKIGFYCSSQILTPIDRSRRKQ